MEYINPAPYNDNEWFSGDVVPFERCAYVVNLNSDSTNTKYYNFHRLQTAIRYDPILQYKKVVTQVDHSSDTYSRALDSSLVSDIPLYHVEIGYWPHKGAFFYFNKGYIYLIHDPNADMQDFCECPPDGFDVVNGIPSNVCEETVNKCDTSRMVDPCHRDHPLFAAGTVPLFH